MEFFINSSKYQENINETISLISSDIEKENLFDGLTNQEILDFYYGEKVYQFYPFELGLHCKPAITFVNDTKVIIKLVSDPHLHGEIKTVGEIEGTDALAVKKMLLENKGIDIRLYGGRYKQVILKEDGSDSVKSFREPYKLTLHLFKPKENVVNHEKNITVPENDLIKIGNSLQKTGNIMNKSGKSLSNVGCSSTLGCTMPIILLIILLLLFL